MMARAHPTLALRPLLPADWTVYVQFDSWYASERLLKY